MQNRVIIEFENPSNELIDAIKSIAKALKTKILVNTNKPLVSEQDFTQTQEIVNYELSDKDTADLLETLAKRERGELRFVSEEEIIASTDKILASKATL